MGRIIDIAGEKFSRLFVLHCAGRDKFGNAVWRCRCDCGNESVVAGNLLRNHNTKTCGQCPKNRYEERDGYVVGYISTGQEFLFDKADFAIVCGHNWSFDNGYARTMLNGCSRLFLHTLLLGVGRGVDGMYADHINHNKLDNRRCNLRVATKSQNGMNRFLQTNNTTGYKGVGYMPQKDKYRARIKVNGCEKHLGLFPTAKLAALAYDRAALKLHGEFAFTNFSRQEVSK